MPHDIVLRSSNKLRLHEIVSELRVTRARCQTFGLSNPVMTQRCLRAASSQHDCLSGREGVETIVWPTVST